MCVKFDRFSCPIQNNPIPSSKKHPHPIVPVTLLLSSLHRTRLHMQGNGFTLCESNIFTESSHVKIDDFPIKKNTRNWMFL